MNALYTMSQLASAEMHLARQSEWRFVRIDGIRYAKIPSGRSNHLYTLPVDTRGCTCRYWQDWGKACAHRLALEIQQDEEAAEAGLATWSEIDVAASEIAAQAWARQDAYERLFPAESW